MGNDPKHIKQFTEAESPIPLVPTDEAWRHMRQKLDEQLPGKRRRGFFAGWKGWFIAMAILAGLAVYYFLFLKAGSTTVSRNSNTAQLNNNREQAPHNKSNTTIVSGDTAAGSASLADSEIIRQQQDTLSAKTGDPGINPGAERIAPATGSNSDPQQQVGRLKNVDGPTGSGKANHEKEEQSTGNAESTTGRETPVSDSKNQPARSRPPGRQVSGDDLITGNKTVGQKNSKAGKTRADHENPGAVKHDTGISQVSITDKDEVAHPATAYSAVQQPDLTPDPLVTSDMAALTAARNAVMDSATGELPSKNKRILFTAGLQWRLPAPLHNSDRYFTGPDGGDQPYRLLIPAVWVSLQKNRHRITLDASAFQSIIISENVYAAFFDSGLHYKKSVLKTFGYQAGLHYNYSFFRHWRAGAGIQGFFLQKALGRRTVDSFPHIKNTFTIKRGHSDWEQLSSFRLQPNIELWFQQPRWEAGLRIGMPVTRPFRDAGIQTRNNIQAALLLRWRIL